MNKRIRSLFARFHRKEKEEKEEVMYDLPTYIFVIDNGGLLTATDDLLNLTLGHKEKVAVYTFTEVREVNVLESFKYARQTMRDII